MSANKIRELLDELELVKTVTDKRMQAVSRQVAASFPLSTEAFVTKVIVLGLVLNAYKDLFTEPTALSLVAILLGSLVVFTLQRNKKRFEKSVEIELVTIFINYAINCRVVQCNLSNVSGDADLLYEKREVLLDLDGVEDQLNSILRSVKTPGLAIDRIQSLTSNVHSSLTTYFRPYLNM